MKIGSTFKKIILATFLIMVVTLPVLKVSAAPNVVDPFLDICDNPAAANSATCRDKVQGQTGNPLYGPDGILTKIILLVSLLVGFASVVSIIYGGLKMVTSGDNTQEVSKARDLVIYSLIALVIAISARIMVQFILTKL